MKYTVANTEIHNHSLDLRVSFLPETGQSLDSDDQMLQARTRFFSWVKALLHESKHTTFANMFTNENGSLMTNIKRELSRVFYGKRIDKITINSESQTNDFGTYRKEQLNDWDFFRNIAYNRLFFSPNDIVLVYGQTLDTPELNLIKFESISDFQVKENTNILTKVCFDTESGEFEANETGFFLNKELIYEHGLGYCPATFIFPSEPSKEKQSSPLSPFVGSLKKLQFFKNSKDIADLVPPFPITAKYKNECDIDDCSGGVLDNGQACTTCTNSALVGAGSIIEVPIPYDEDKSLLEAVKFITSDTTSLEYIGATNDKRAESLFFSIVGITEEIRKEAMNELQIQASFDSRENTLRRFASVIEKAHKFCLQASAEMRYGMGSIQDISFSYGFYFFKSEIDMTEEAKEKAILEAVIPYFNIELSELQQYKDIIPSEELILRLQYQSLVSRFESENGSILEFGKLNPQNKNSIIKETLLSYINNNSNDSGKQDRSTFETE